MADWHFDLVAGPFDDVVDGPLWDEGGLLFCLIEGSRILRYEPASGAVSELRRYTARTRALALDGRGNVYGSQAGSRRIVRFNGDGSATPMEARLDGRFH